MKFEEMVINLIEKDTKLTEAVKSKITEAIDKINLTEQIQTIVEQAIEDVLENIDLTDAISEPIRKAISKIIADKLAKP